MGELLSFADVKKCQDPFQPSAEFTPLEQPCTGSQDRCAKLKKDGKVFARGCATQSLCGRQFENGFKISCCDKEKCNSAAVNRCDLLLLLVPLAMLLLFR